MAAGAEKMWGQNVFWGVGYDYDPLWFFTEEHVELQKKLIDLCRTKIRPLSTTCDRRYEFPRASLDALAELGLLGLIIPTELGGLGENHVCAAMVVETIARYGCPSTAMVYVMHLSAVATLLFRYHDNPTIQSLLPRINREKLVGTLSYSDPATGGHFWFPLSSKCRRLADGQVQLLKVGSWATSAGFADWYTVQTVSPDFGGDYGNLTCFLLYQDEVRANTDDWVALGMHGNQSGPLICEGVFSESRRIGPYGDGSLSNDECVDPLFLLLTSSCWNGIALGCVDIARRHVTRKAHADMGVRVCDYPTIQDYFGESMCESNSCRAMVFSVAQGMDIKTGNNDWRIHRDLTVMPRSKFLHWLWQVKFVAAKNVATVSDTMMRSCGGTGYKEQLGLERLFRDGRAGWVMGPSNEVLRQFVGKTVLVGFDAIDYWDQKVNKRMVHHELQKMTVEEKEELAKTLLEDVRNSTITIATGHTEQGTDFDNPFNTQPPACVNQVVTAADKQTHSPGLKPEEYVSLRLIARNDVSEKMASFRFALPSPSDHLGCLPGQYVKVRVRPAGKPPQERFFSPVSPPDQFGEVEVVLRYETQGLLSKHFRTLQPGDLVEFRGPCGGFEYRPNTLAELSLIAAGGGITPGLQLIRCVMADPADRTRLTLLYWSETYDEILYREELDGYSAGDSRLTVVHTLGEVSESWDGEEGFVDTDMIQRHLAKPLSARHKVVLCGGPTMVISCLYSLQQLGYPAEDIFVYGQFGVEQVKMVFGRHVKLSSHRCDA